MINHLFLLLFPSGFSSYIALFLLCLSPLLFLFRRQYSVAKCAFFISGRTTCFYCGATCTPLPTEAHDYFLCHSCKSVNAFDQNGEIRHLPEHSDASLNTQSFRPQHSDNAHLRTNPTYHSSTDAVLCNDCLHSQQIRTRAYLCREEYEMHEPLPFDSLCKKCDRHVKDYYRTHYSWYLDMMRNVPGIMPRIVPAHRDPHVLRTIPFYHHACHLCLYFLSMALVPGFFASLPILRYFGYCPTYFISRVINVWWPASSILNDKALCLIALMVTACVQIFGHNPLYVAYHHYRHVFRKEHYPVLDRTLAEYRQHCFARIVVPELFQLVVPLFLFDQCIGLHWTVLSFMSTAVTFHGYYWGPTTERRILRQYNSESCVLPRQKCDQMLDRMGILDQIRPRPLIHQDETPAQTPIRSEPYQHQQSISPDELTDRISAWDTGARPQVSQHNHLSRPSFPPLDPNIPRRPQGFGHHNVFRASLATNISQVNPHSIPTTMYLRPGPLDPRDHVKQLPYTFAPKPHRPTRFDAVLEQQARDQLQRLNERKAREAQALEEQRRAAFNLSSGPRKYFTPLYVHSDRDDDEGPGFWNPYGNARPFGGR